MKKLLILASGKGTRMIGVTKGHSKEMLEFKGKTIISLAIEEAISAGFSDICIVSNKEKKDLNNFLLSEKTKGLPIRILLEEKAVNLITSLKFAEDFINKEDFGMLFPDMLILGEESGMSQLVSSFKKLNKPLIGLVKQDEFMGSTWYFYGDKISNKVAKINGIVKENISGFRFFPRYILPGSSLEIIKSLENKESEVGLLNYIIKNGGLYGVFLEGQPIDTGIPEGYSKSKN